MYVIDTNFLGELTTTYPEDIFPSLWKELEVKLFVPGICFHDEVHEEMKSWGILVLRGMKTLSAPASGCLLMGKKS